METATLCGSKLHKHVRVGELHRVVARMHLLCLVLEACGSLLEVLHGQERHVTEAANASAREVHVAETDELVVVIVVARAPVPAACRLGRTELNESERHVGAHERVAMTARSDILIYVLREILSRSGSGCNTKAYSK